MQADRGFAFVKLDTHENAAMAIIQLQGQLVHGRPIKCSWGKDRSSGEGGQPGAAMAPTPGVQGYGTMVSPFNVQCLSLLTYGNSLCMVYRNLVSMRSSVIVIPVSQALRPAPVSLDILEFNAWTLADSSFGGIDNVERKSGSLRI